MLFSYIATLILSAGLVGIFAHDTVAELGFVAGFQGRVLLTGGAACVYTAAQLVFMGLLRLLYPTRSTALYGAETASHLTAFLLVPHVLGISIPWPVPGFESLEPLVYLAVFAAAHVLCKLAAFYASLRGERVPQWTALAWLALAGLFAWGAYAGLDQWLDEVEAARPRTGSAQSAYRIGDQYAWARTLPEGSTVIWGAEPYEGQTLTFRWAPLPGDDTVGERIYVTVTLIGAERKTYASPVRVGATRWGEMRVPPEYIPRDFREGSVYWTRRPEPNWQRLIGIRPVVYGNGPADAVEARPPAMLMSGPFNHEARPAATGLNFLLIAVEGLGAGRVSAMGYANETTPAIDRLAYRALAFSNAFTPAADVSAAVMTLFTGLNPYRHGYLGSSSGPLPEGHPTLAEILKERHYVTAAFTEGEARGHDDLVFNTGFERGFEVFDPSYPGVDARSRETAGEGPDASGSPATRSRATLEKVRDWVSAHRNLKFFTFVRLRHLRDFALAARAEPKAPDGMDAVTLSEAFDAAIADLDQQIGALIQYIRDRETRRNTCIIITSPYGYEIDPRQPGQLTKRLDEESLRVPLVFYVPGIGKRRRRDLVGLEDVAPTIARIARTSFRVPLTGKNFLDGALDKNPVSVSTDPPGRSIRTPKWRYTWQDTDGAPGVFRGLYQVSDNLDWWWRNRYTLFPNVANRLEKELETYVQAIQVQPRPQ